MISENRFFTLLLQFNKTTNKFNINNIVWHNKKKLSRKSYRIVRNTVLCSPHQKSMTD